MSYLADPDPIESLGFILAEEKALKRHLSGHTVPDRRGNLVEVPVRYRWAGSEDRRTYPFILVDLIAVSPDYTRFTSVYDLGQAQAIFEDWETGAEREGMYKPSESPDVDPDKVGFRTDNYHPYKLTFQVQHVTRSVLHDRYLQGRFLTDLFPPRQWFIGVGADSTWRRCELLEWANLDAMETSEADKVEYRKAYTISMEAEIMASELVLLSSGTVRHLHADIYDKTQGPATEPVGHPVDGPHRVALDTVDVVAPSGP